MSHQEISSGLDSASKQQEKDLVIDLAPDRILHHLGVNLLIILAVITKVTEVTGSKLTCFPINEAGSTLQFIKYTNSFCWESPAMALNSSVNECQFPENQTVVKQDQLLENAFHTKRMIQWLPYVMLLEAFLFALPMAYWHFTLGAVLMGHLKFMGLLLESIYETLKEIPSGIYRKEPYDPESKCFNCWREWQNQNEEEKEEQNSKSVKPKTELTYENESPQSSSENKNPSTSTVANEDKAEQGRTVNDSQENSLLLKKNENEQHVGQVQEGDSQVGSSSTDGSTESRVTNDHSHSPNQSDSITNSFDKTIQAVKDPEFTKGWRQILKGTTTETKTDRKTDTETDKMQDRHIFSMLCYENFASMHHQPYLESVEQLSRVQSFEDKMFKGVPSIPPQDGKPDGIILPLKHAILRRFCDEENFNACVVVQRYQIKSALTIALGALVWILILTTFVFTVHPTLRSDSFLWIIVFRCHIPYHEKYCSVCTMSGLIDVHAAFFSNWIVVTLHLIISCVNLWYFTRAGNRAIAHFLDDIKPLCCVALAAAYEYQKANPKTKGDKQKLTSESKTQSGNVK